MMTQAIKLAPGTSLVKRGSLVFEAIEMKCGDQFTLSRLFEVGAVYTVLATTLNFERSTLTIDVLCPDGSTDVWEITENAQFNTHFLHHFRLLD